MPRGRRYGIGIRSQQSLTFNRFGCSHVVGLMASVEVIVSERSNPPERTDGTILKLRQPLLKLVVALVLQKKSTEVLQRGRLFLKPRFNAS